MIQNREKGGGEERKGKGAEVQRIEPSDEDRKGDQSRAEQEREAGEEEIALDQDEEETQLSL